MKNIIFPSVYDIKLAEFTGCLLGDGYIGEQYEISVTENSKLDVNHSFYVYRLIKNLFGINSSIFVSKKRNAIRCKIYSKPIQEFLVDKLNLVKGNKVKNRRLKIPRLYFKDRKYLKACLRGLFDTDGCFCRHRISEPMIEIDSLNNRLRNSILEALKILNFSVSYSGRKIYIYSAYDIKRFFNEIGSNNTRNMIKYEFWLNNNIVPKTNQIKVINKKILTKLRNSISKDWVKLDIKDLYGFGLKIDTCADSLVART